MNFCKRKEINLPFTSHFCLFSLLHQAESKKQIYRKEKKTNDYSLFGSCHHHTTICFRQFTNTKIACGKIIDHDYVY
jgi:hypothetical protein